MKLNEKGNGLLIALIIVSVIALIAIILFGVVVKKNYRLVDKDELTTMNKEITSDQTTDKGSDELNSITLEETNPLIKESSENITEGLDYPMETWLLVKKGSLLSADAAIWDGDNNNLKTPIYDNIESTADIIFFEEDVYIWLEWGGHLIENATEKDVVVLINNKISSGYTVRYFSNFTKLGNHDYIPYDSKITE